MSEISDFILTSMINYGPAAFAVILLLGAMGAPWPSVVFVVAAGAFVRQDVMARNWTFGLGLVGVMSGDTGLYLIGRFAHRWLEGWLGKASAWQQAQTTFDRRGGLAIYLTRFLLTPLAIPTNLIAGGSGYAFWRFFGYDLAGEITWLVLFGGLGYLAGSQWELIAQFVSDFSGLLVGLAVLAGGIYLFIRYLLKIGTVPMGRHR